MMVGIFNAFIGIGMVFGMMLGAYIALRWGWRHAFGRCRSAGPDRRHPDVLCSGV